MKKRIAAVLLLLSLLISNCLVVSARDSEYYEEDGVRYCWVRGGPTDKPTERDAGYTWIAVYENGRPVTRLGVCDSAGDPDHVCDLFCNFNRLEYKWKRVMKEILIIESLKPDGYAMTGSEFILLQQKIKTNADGSYQLDAEGKLQYESSDVICKAIVESDGYARMRLDESRLDPEESFHQLVLGQILAEEQLDTYSALQNRWYVNLVMNSDEEYEVYSVTEAPVVNITDPDELQNSNFGVLGEESVPEYNSALGTLTTRNAYRLGDLAIEIEMQGFEGEVPAQAKSIINISGPNGYSKRIRRSDTLRELRMGEYFLTVSAPAEVDGYDIVSLEVTLQCPVEADPVELTEDVKTVLLNRDHANALVKVVYTYEPEHVHIFDEGVVTEPTCTEKGHTTYTCTDPECGFVVARDIVDAYGHDYKVEVKEVTCTEDGYAKYTCTVCGHTYEELNGEAEGHDFQETLKNPTCTEKGYTIHTCSRCGATYIDEETQPIGHDYRLTGEVIAPTCTEQAKIMYACMNCGGEKSEPGEAAIGHDFVFTDVINPTCTENGYRVYQCTRCEEEKKEDGKEAEGHKYAKEVTKPTCTEKGYTKYTCVLCEYSYQGDEVKATGHSYVSKVVEPTTEREGYTLHTCSVCKDTYTDNPQPKLTVEDSDDNGSGDEGSGDGGSGTNTGNSTANAGSVKPSTISGSAVDTLIVKSIDDQEKPLKGAVVALYSGNTAVQQWNSTYDNVSVLDNLDKYAKEGEIVYYTLKQSKAPNGYELSRDSFTVGISKQSGKTVVDVKKNAGSSGSVEIGRDGKQIATFSNIRKTTQMELTCHVEVEFGEDCWTDDALLKEYQEKVHEFVLKWKNAAGEEQTESVQLCDGEFHLLEAKLPFGSEYELALAGADSAVIAEFSENASGTISTRQIEGKVAADVTLKYTVRADETMQMKVLIADAESGKALNGAIFEVKDPDGTKVGSYTSDTSGVLDISEAFTAPGDYLLDQTQAPAGYQLLNGAAPVIVSFTYEPDAETGLTIVQKMSAQIAHQSASREEDGSYRIEMEIDATPTQQEERNGMGLGAILGIAGGVVAVGGVGATSFVLLRRKRRQELL